MLKKIFHKFLDFCARFNIEFNDKINDIKNDIESAQKDKAKIIIKDGFDFGFIPSKCENCGSKCCRGEEGYIFVSIDEIKQISEFLKLDFNEFCLKFVKKVGYKYSLIEVPDPQGSGFACVFLECGENLENSKNNNDKSSKVGCKIYPVRPAQCASFPFWSCFAQSAKIEQNASLNADLEHLFKECCGVVKK